MKFYAPIMEKQFIWFSEYDTNEIFREILVVKNISIHCTYLVSSKYCFYQYVLVILQILCVCVCVCFFFRKIAKV